MIGWFFAFLHVRYGQLFLRKKPAKAIAILEAGAIKYPDYPFLFLHLGLAYAEQENWEKAEYYIQKARNITPANPVFDLFMGKVFIDSEDYQKAIDVLNKSIEKDNKNQLSWSYLALAHLGVANIEEFQKIIDTKSLSENRELQIRMILMLEKHTRKIDDEL